MDETEVWIRATLNAIIGIIICGFMFAVDNPGSIMGDYMIRLVESFKFTLSILIFLTLLCGLIASRMDNRQLLIFTLLSFSVFVVFEYFGGEFFFSFSRLFAQTYFSVEYGPLPKFDMYPTFVLFYYGMALMVSGLLIGGFRKLREYWNNKTKNLPV
ncbi:MAG: hypothetical protein ACM3UZ_16050 [Acidobacteriota bacterium]